MRKRLLSLCILSSAAMADYRSLNGQPVTLEGPGWQHLVFINIWDSFANGGPEGLMEELPSRFSNNVKRIWVSPDMNITPAYLRDYQVAFPESKPLIIDRHFQLLRSYKLWKTPAHVLLKDGNLQFSGSGKALQQYISKELKSIRSGVVP